MNRINLLFFVVVIFFTGCSLSKKNKQKEKTITIKEAGQFSTNSLQLLLNISPDTIVINTKKENIISKNNIRLIIPPYAFTTKHRKHPVSVKLIYYLTDDISKMMILGMNTLDKKGNIFSSTGMFYLDAKTQDGEQLGISPESAIGVEIKSNSLNTFYSIYTGDIIGEKIKWTANNRPVETVLSFKSSSIYPDPDWPLFHAPDEYNLLNNKVYDYSNLSTIAIRDRLHHSGDLANYLQWLTGNYNDKPVTDIMDLYVSNRNKPIHICDSLVAEHIRKKLDHCLSLGRKCEYEKDIELMITLYKAFSGQKLGIPFDFSPYQKALNTKNILPNLMSLGLSKARSGFISSLYLRQQRLITTMVNQSKIQNKYNYYEVHQLGWGSISKLYNDKNLSYFKAIASLKNPIPDIQYQASLLIPTRTHKILIDLKVNDGKIHLNSYKEEYKLSIYHDVILVVWGIKKEKCFMGSAKFDSRENKNPEKIDIEMKEITSTEFEEKLNVIVK